MIKKSEVAKCFCKQNRSYTYGTEKVCTIMYMHIVTTQQSPEQTARLRFTRQQVTPQQTKRAPSVKIFR